MRGWNNGINGGFSGSNFNGGWSPRGYGYGMGFPWGETLLILALVALVVGVVWFVARTIKAKKGGAGKLASEGSAAYAGSGTASGGAVSVAASGAGMDRALDIILERYARGEIDTDTLKSMREEIARVAGLES